LLLSDFYSYRAKSALNVAEDAEYNKSQTRKLKLETISND